MPQLNIMFKTVASCNLDCTYCYSKTCHQPGNATLDPVSLSEFFAQYMDYVADTHEANISWQGGEPTLAGLDFFKNIVDIEARNARPPTVISNVIQTNGILIDEEWAGFFAQYRFLVGVSLDGPENIHDLVRKDFSGRGSFKRVRTGIEVLKQKNVELNILCVVGQHNVTRPDELIDYYQSEGFTHLQFMPAMQFQASEPAVPSQYAIDALAYGNFLVNIFNRWYQNGIPIMSVRIFDNFLASKLGIDNDLCIFSEKCNSGLIIEPDGNVYPCDFYIHPDWCLGNIKQDKLAQILEHPLRRCFMAQKHPLSKSCQVCRWVKMCRGECARNRNMSSDGYLGPSYFCQSYKILFKAVDDKLSALAERIRNYRRFNEWQSRHRFTPSKNDNCPCGSGKKHYACCGDPAVGHSYLFNC